MIVKTYTNSLDLRDQLVKFLVVEDTFPSVGYIQLGLGLLRALIIDGGESPLDVCVEFGPSLGDRSDLFRHHDYRAGIIGIH